jgi:hypothetical protein
MDPISKVIVCLLIFGLGCLVGSIAEVQWRGLNGKTIEQCAERIKGNR